MNYRTVSFLALGLLPLALLLGACGGGGDEPANDEAAIRKVVNDFGKAFNDGKAGDLHSLLDEESRESCSEKDLAALLTLVKALAGKEKFSAEATSVKVSGNTATAQVVAAVGNEKQSPDETRLVKEGGKWKLAFGSGDCSL